MRVGLWQLSNIQLARLAAGDTLAHMLGGSREVGLLAAASWGT